MILFGVRKFIISPFNNEAEIEAAVENNYEDIFGPDSIYVPKKKIYSAEGTGTIPDGFVIDLARRQWFLIEAELAHHSLWNHIAPQVAKQIIAATQPSTRALLTEIVVNLAKEDKSIMEKFEAVAIELIDIRQVLGTILEQQPIIGIPIDAVGPDMKEWAQTLRFEVKLWIVRKLVEFNAPGNVLYEIPDDCRPAFDSLKAVAGESRETWTKDDIRFADLVELKLIRSGEVLTFSHKPHGGTRNDFTATVAANGEALIVNGEEISSTSYAAIKCMQSTGSSRHTINGWTAWRVADGRTLSDLRDEIVLRLNGEREEHN